MEYKKAVTKINILIVDDSSEVRNGLHSILSSHADFTIVGEATDGLDAIDKAAHLKPDVILMDAQMPGMNGDKATRRIKDSYPEIKILFLAVHVSDIEEAQAAGVDGYLMKDCRRDELLKAIRNVVAD